MTRRPPRPDIAAGLRQLAFGPPRKGKAANAWQGDAALKNNFKQPQNTPPRRGRQRGGVDPVVALLVLAQVVLAAHLWVVLS